MNVNKLRGRSGQISGRAVGICCVQHVGFRRKCVRIIKGKAARFKLFLTENDKGLRTAGIFLAEKWIDENIYISSASDTMIVITGYLRWEIIFLPHYHP